MVDNSGVHTILRRELVSRKIAMFNSIPMKILGILLIIVGGVMTIFTGFNLTTKKKIVDMGSVEISRREKTPIYWSPVTGGIVAAVGILILVMGKRK